MISWNQAMSGRKPSLLYVKYKDHVEFRNADPNRLTESTREVVGWLVGETVETMCLCCDRSVEPVPFMKPSESGFIILKSDVLEVRRTEVKERLDGKIG